MSGREYATLGLNKAGEELVKGAKEEDGRPIYPEYGHWQVQPSYGKNMELVYSDFFSNYVFPDKVLEEFVQGSFSSQEEDVTFYALRDSQTKEIVPESLWTTEDIQKESKTYCEDNEELYIHWEENAE